MSLHHMLSKDELIVLVETIESHVENKYRLMHRKYEALQQADGREVRLCNLCDKFEVRLCPFWYWFSDDQKWSHITNDDDRTEFIKTYGNKTIYECDCMCGCCNTMCKQCCEIFDADRNYTVCKACKDCNNKD